LGIFFTSLIIVESKAKVQSMAETSKSELTPPVVGELLVGYFL
jgi:hypothetical protein